MLLQRPHVPKIETCNDKDAFIANAWRALQAAPEEVAQWCDRPPNEADQHAVHIWLVNQREAFTARLMGDPDYYDARVAGRWLYGVCCWIGSGWCAGDGPWQNVEGELRRSEDPGIRRKRVHLGDAGQGVHRQLVHLGNAGRGVHRKRVHLGGHGGGTGVHKGSLDSKGLYAWFAALQARLRYVRVCCGDWARVLGPSVTIKHGLTGVLLDPPYSAEEDRDDRLYAMEDLTIAHDVRAWCVANGDESLLRLVLCGYGTIHDELLRHGWRKIAWTAHSGMGNQKKNGINPNKYRERLWLSPHCLTTAPETQLTLFGGATP